MIRFFFILPIILIFSACNEVAVDSRRAAQLMPQPVAKNILLKHFSADWVENPYGHYVQGGRLCGDNGRGELPFRSITKIQVHRDIFNGRNRIIIRNQNVLLAFVPCAQVAAQLEGYFSSGDIRDIVDALVSLGAQIEEKPVSD